MSKQNLILSNLLIGFLSISSVLAADGVWLPVTAKTCGNQAVPVLSKEAYLYNRTKGFLAQDSVSTDTDSLSCKTARIFIAGIVGDSAGTINNVSQEQLSLLLSDAGSKVECWSVTAGKLSDAPVSNQTLPPSDPSFSGSAELDINSDVLLTIKIKGSSECKSDTLTITLSNPQ